MEHTTHAHEADTTAHPGSSVRGQPAGAESHAHDRHEGHSVAMFRDKFWLSLTLTIPVVAWSSDVQSWLGYRAPVFPGSTLIAPILELLLRRSPAVVDRKAIAEHGWADETDPLGSNAIDVQLSRLRAKLPNAGIRIVTVRGAGYRLEEA